MADAAENHLIRMIAGLRSDRCISSEEVAEAFASVPRHLFLPGMSFRRVYAHREAIPTHVGEDGVSTSSSSAPNIMALMLEQLAVQSGHRVLEIGAGTGYNAGLLAHLTGPSGSVVSIDFDTQVAREATEHLRSAGIRGVEVMAADGWLGVPGDAGFDRIVATVEIWDLSPHWMEQLRPGGILVAPMWLRPGVEASVAFVKAGDVLESRSLACCGFMPFRGPHAGPPRRAMVGDWAAGPHDNFGATGWIAEFDDATPERNEILRTLLRGPSTVAQAPPLFKGWNIRLGLEEVDPITFVRRDVIGHSVTGLFDADERSVALVDGAVLCGFGAPSCLERLATSLERASPFNLESARIAAVPHGRSDVDQGAVVLSRPNFDLVVQGLD